MFWDKIQVLANTIVNYSLKIHKGEKLLIDVKGEGADQILTALVEKTLAAGGIPFWNRNQDTVLGTFISHANHEQMKVWGQMHRAIMESVDAYVAIRGADNAYELSNVTAAAMKSYVQNYQEVVHTKLRVPKKKWVVLRWPNHSMAQLAQMNTQDFMKFYFDTCTLDYSKMRDAMQPLVDLMMKTDQVRLKGPGETDLTFSIKGIPALPCAGEMNIPDGEVYTAPVKDSMNGVMAYNTPTLFQGRVFEQVKLTVKNGKIIKATCANQPDIEKIFDTDEGARYFGEFAIGVNPFVTTPMKDTLFDEKIYGSIHLTPGNSYDNAPNGNHSAIHWDMVLIQTPAYGGGEIYFDGKLIRKDGEFVLPELKQLNRQK